MLYFPVVGAVATYMGEQPPSFEAESNQFTRHLLRGRAIASIMLFVHCESDSVGESAHKPPCLRG